MHSPPAHARAALLACAAGAVLLGCPSARDATAEPVPLEGQAPSNDPRQEPTGSPDEGPAQRPEASPTSLHEAAPASETGPTPGHEGTEAADPGTEAAGAADVVCGDDGVCAAPCPDAAALAARFGPVDVACVPGGTFVRGRDEALTGCDPSDQPRGVTPSVPAAHVWIDTFAMQRHEVTVEEYEACVEAGACRAVRALYREFNTPRRPHTGGTWFDARDYCAWRGMRLPTEAEFEAAIRGPEGELTPFGDTDVTCDEAVIEDERGRACGVRQQRARDADRGLVAEVGSRPAGRYGLFDLVGNAEEWVQDWWTPSWADCGADCEGANPRGPCGGAESCAGHRYRSVRGGSWYWPAACANGLHRRRQRPENDPPHHFSFRCAASLDGLAPSPAPVSP